MVSASNGSQQLAVDGPGDHLRFADGELRPFTAHLLDQHRKRQFATALHLPASGGRCRPRGSETLPTSSLSRRLRTMRAGQLVAGHLAARGDGWFRWLPRSRLIDGDAGRVDVVGIGESVADHDLR